MQLTLTPQQGLPGQAEMTIAVAEETITIDGTPYDLSAVPEGGEGWPDEGPFIGPITRQGGVLNVTIIARLGEDAAPDQEGPWQIPQAQGVITLPAFRKAQTA